MLDLYLHVYKATTDISTSAFTTHPRTCEAHSQATAYMGNQIVTIGIVFMLPSLNR